jgi:hypothetical protein
MNHFALSKTGAHSGKVAEQRNNVPAEFVLGDLRFHSGGAEDSSSGILHCLV